MPIQDFNGTTAYQIGNVQDFDGTTAHQIGKVHDFDGTTSHLIYTAEQDVFNYGATPYGWGGYSSQGVSEWALVNGDHINVTATGTGFSRVYTYSPISLAGYSTLNVYFLTGNNTYYEGPVGIELLNNISDMSIGGPRATYTERWPTADTPSTYQTLSLPLAGYNTGSYYIGVFANATSSYNGGTSMMAYRIWLT